MTELDIPKYNTFFEDYRSLESKFWDKKWEVERGIFNEFQVRFQDYEIEAKELYASETPDFNIFSILRLGRYEERLHTPFLRYLLDPTESHGQGYFFLLSFLSEMLKVNLDRSEISHLSIEEEFRNDNGRMDLLIRYSHKSESKAIVIENKIYAKDQPDQLQKYKRYLTVARGYDADNILLVYLTPWGTNPSENSMVEIERDALKLSGNLTLLSYRKNIQSWLTNSLATDNIKSEKLKHIISQYIKTISVL